MKGYIQDIESIATVNRSFRRVLYTARHCQLVVMSLEPREDIGAEVHTLYAPPNHRDGVVHPTRADAQADTERFDGGTSE